MFIPKVKTVKVQAEVCSSAQDRMSPRGEFEPGKLPMGGFNPVWNFKTDQPNDYLTRKQSPTTGGGGKVY
jgi:hypothetical protein